MKSRPVRVRTELFPDIVVDTMLHALVIQQEDGNIWIDLSDVPNLQAAIRSAVGNQWRAEVIKIYLEGKEG